eukprot:4604409-Prymnesium_polylepis.1
MHTKAAIAKQYTFYHRHATGTAGEVERAASAGACAHGTARRARQPGTRLNPCDRIARRSRNTQTPELPWP